MLSLIGDSHAAMSGHGRFTPGTVKATYGTGSSLMALTEGLCEDTPVLARTIAWSIKGIPQYALEGNIAMTGSAVQWLGEFLGFEMPPTAWRIWRRRSPIAQECTLCRRWWDWGRRTGMRRHADRLRGLAAITKLRTLRARPWRRLRTRWQMCFLRWKRHQARASESCMQTAERRETHMLMQFQADVLGCPVMRSKNEELSAMGAAWLAGLALGWWTSMEELGIHAQARVDASLRRWRLTTGRRCMRDGPMR